MAHKRLSLTLTHSNSIFALDRLLTRRGGSEVIVAFLLNLQLQMCTFPHQYHSIPLNILNLLLLLAKYLLQFANLLAKAKTLGPVIFNRHQ
jgi:hypothetical protein